MPAAFLLCQLRSFPKRLALIKQVLQVRRNVTVSVTVSNSYKEFMSLSWFELVCSISMHCSTYMFCQLRSFRKRLALIKQVRQVSCRMGSTCVSVIYMC
jgi:hypothetical protein